MSNHLKRAALWAVSVLIQAAGVAGAMYFAFTVQGWPSLLFLLVGIMIVAVLTFDLIEGLTPGTGSSEWVPMTNTVMGAALGGAAGLIYLSHTSWLDWLTSPTVMGLLIGGAVVIGGLLSYIFFPKKEANARTRGI